MPGKTRILIVEDNALDHELIIRELKRAGVDFTSEWVASEAAFRGAIQKFRPDLILSDHSLPTFSAHDALRIAGMEAPRTPVIIVTGSLDDETAVEYLKAGASDYILKHKLIRLGPAALRVLEQRRAAEEHHRSQELLGAIFDAAPVAVYTVDPTGVVKSWNPAAERMFGWTADEVIGKPLPVVTGPKRAEHEELLRKVLRGETITGLEITRVNKAGKPVEVRLYAAPLHDSAGATTGIMAMAADVSEVRQLEAQYRQSQKMEAVGRLAGGIAHDFNNLLTVILLEAELLSPQLAEGDPVAEALTQITQAAEQAATLTRQLLAFSRQQVVAPTVFVVNELVSQTEKMLKRLIGEDVELVSRLSPDLRPVKADKGQIQQVLVNLAVNARDAMPDGGVLTIETSNVSLDSHYVQQQPEAKVGEYVCMVVSDTGSGMSAETLSRIFEPFFTTKQMGRGTGLGLATCYGIVKQAGGHITVYSEPKIGTTMRVYIPAAAETTVAAAPDAHQSSPRGRGQTVLLVEDQQAVLNVATRILEVEGYRVLKARSADEALPILESSWEKVDLLLTDIVLPGMKGGALAERARELRPGLKVLFASGYTGDVVDFHDLASKNADLIQKPFTAKSLSDKVREVLES